MTYPATFPLVGALSAALLSVAACTPTAKDVASVEALSDVNCSTRPGECVFAVPPVEVRNDPVELPKRPYKFFPMARALSFTDAQNRVWVAPQGTLTDGASIPPIFVSIVGSPTAPEYIEAAAIHDAYCGIGNEGGASYHNGRWQDVHRMFYDALVAAGTPDRRAKVMFAAVWLGGPRWNVLYGLENVPVARRQQGMAKAKRYIEARDPSLSQLEAWLLRLEKAMIRDYPDRYPQYSPDEAPREESYDFDQDNREEEYVEETAYDYTEEAYQEPAPDTFFDGKYE